MISRGYHQAASQLRLIVEYDGPPSSTSRELLTVTQHEYFDSIKSGDR